MNCLYCDAKIEKETLKSLFIKKDLLCPKCREQIKPKRRKIKGEEIYYYFDYDSLFKDLLIQYKECYDEALKDIFLYDLKEELKIRYRGYKILYAPSTKKKLEERGFNHLKGIFECLKLEEVEGLFLKEELCQEGKNIKDREKMIDNYIYKGKKINKLLIVDDVITTGSTIKGLKKALKCDTNVTVVIALSKKQVD